MKKLITLTIYIFAVVVAGISMTWFLDFILTGDTALPITQEVIGVIVTILVGFNLLDSIGLPWKDK